MESKKWRDELITTVKPGNFRIDEPMSRLTSFRIGGPADLVVEVETPEELALTVEYCKKSAIPWFLFGRGSNLLVRDEGIRGVVLRLGKDFQYTKVEGRKLRAGAASALAVVAEAAARNGLSGLEFASGIPGSLGGAVFMNAGAYGSEMRDVVVEVDLYRPAKGFETLTNEEIKFAYRSSGLQQEEGIVLNVVLNLTPGDEEQIREQMSNFNLKRKEKQPLEFPSAGSTFKRPEGNFAGRLIEEAGLKGKRLGNAQVSPKHAGFIINLGGATAREVLDLIDLVRREVHKKSGIWLEPEIKVVGGE